MYKKNYQRRRYIICMCYDFKRPSYITTWWKSIEIYPSTRMESIYLLPFLYLLLIHHTTHTHNVIKQHVHLRGVVVPSESTIKFHVYTNDINHVPPPYIPILPLMQIYTQFSPKNYIYVRLSELLQWYSKSINIDNVGTTIS